jgi:hypothetical protein
MSTILGVEPEELAKLFHQYQQLLGGDFESRSECLSSWEHTPSNERRLLVAAARLTLDELSFKSEEKPTRPYFAKPGEAEWGC